METDSYSAGPYWLIEEPLSLSPLAKKSAENPLVTERFHPIIAGTEMGNGFSELNDPLDQLERFQEQQAARDAGDEEAQKDTLSGLKSAHGYIKRELAHSVNLRNTPDIRFILDQSIEYGVNMSRKIDEITAELHKGEEGA